MSVPLWCSTEIIIPALPEEKQENREGGKKKTKPTPKTPERFNSVLYSWTRTTGYTEMDSIPWGRRQGRFVTETDHLLTLLNWLLATLSHAQISSTNTLNCRVAEVTSAAKEPKQFLLQLSIFSPWKLAISWYAASCCLIPLHLGRPVNYAFSKLCWQSLLLSALLITCFKTACPFTLKSLSTMLMDISVFSRLQAGKIMPKIPWIYIQ